MNITEEYLVPFSNSEKPDFPTSVRSLFYLLTPKESSFENVTQVPNYTDSVSHCAKFRFII